MKRHQRQHLSVHLFPGQGTFSVASLTGALSRSRLLRDAFDEVVGQTDPIAIAHGQEPLGDELTGPTPPSTTDLAHAGRLELAMFVTAMAAHRALSRMYGPPTALVGVSLGDLPALAAAGAYTVPDGARLILAAAPIQRACPGRMVHLACSARMADQILERSGVWKAAPALVNDDRSVVITTPRSGVHAIQTAAAVENVPAALVPVPFGSHHPELGKYAEEGYRAIRPFEHVPTDIPVYSAAGARRYCFRGDIARQISDNLVTRVDLPAVLARCMQHRPDIVLDLDTSGSLATSARAVLPDDRSNTVRAPFQEERFPW
ncbi:acyltransferase [Streptomyces sp. NBC_01174]|uniref:acyltransferase n=1 Tax=Streptomyces sp. NBC_01174 TaxID=2903758 RepID=UPI00386B7F4A|nr:acyltransferase [Streptomyces sp. NBC_01177]WSS74469.1 acyltransferase [Streptomyces sp. NBC_01174]